MSDKKGSVLALSGGVGGAKLALGLYRVLPPETLTVVANTGDDFEHLGLAISPDLDTLLYTLSGQANPELGWGRQGETWTFMRALEALGGETWFRLGDGDLATHVERTRRLRAGESLSAIIDDFRRRLGIRARLLPMSDDPVRTRLRTLPNPHPNPPPLAGEGVPSASPMDPPPQAGEGRVGVPPQTPRRAADNHDPNRFWLDFQDYFVRLRCEPVISELAFAGAETARPYPDFLAAIAAPKLRAVVICPSNPFISIDPILAVPGVRDALRDCRAPVVAVSPIVAGQAVKGPTAKMMAELGMPVGAATPSRHYRDFLDLYIADEADAAAVADLEIPVVLARTLMQTPADHEALARTVLAAADRIGEMIAAGDIWAVVPVKDTAIAKQRLAPALPAEQRQGLALAMLEDVLAALAETRGLAGVLLVTIDPAARHLAPRYGADCIEDGARDGHTGAVTAAARRLAAEGRGAMVTLPGDIPLVTSAEIARLIAAHRPAPSFTIAPSHDEMGSNAILMSPPDAVSLRFGDDSFRPHLAAARAAGIEPTIVRLPGIALDIDNPADLAHFWPVGSRTRAGLWLAQHAGALASAGLPRPPAPGTRRPS